MHEPRVGFHGRGMRRRAGYTILEVQVAFVLLGIGLAGICPLVVMQVRMSSKVQKGFNPQTAYFRAGTTCYVVPASDPWERKLGVAASLRTTPTRDPFTTSLPAYIVTVTAPVQKALGVDAVTVHVKVTPLPKGGG